MVKQFEKLNEVIPTIEEATKAEFELVMPKAKTPEFSLDEWDGPVMQQMLGEEIYIPDLIDLGSVKEMIAVIEAGGQKPLDPEAMVMQSTMPLKNWETLSGPFASKEEMVTKLGLVPRPLVSTYLKSSESLIIEFEFLESSDGLTPEDYEIVANDVLPFALNEMIDLFEYPLIATLTNDS